MNYMFANEECSSGCESGWTLYLDQSASISPQNESCSHGGRNPPTFDKSKRLKEEEEEDEDLSMVSDASSGPPHLHEEDGYGGNDNNINHYTVDETLSRNSAVNMKKKKLNRENRRRNKAQELHSSLLDDTASSPFFDFSNKNFNLTRSKPSMENVLEYSQGYSTTQFEVRPPYQQHYDFFQASQSGNQLQQQNQW